MLRYARVVVPSVLLAGAGAWFGLMRTVSAGPPSTSPSVRQAAILKYAPPPGWIRHYLGDDRYKISGGTWQVVSTEMDTYYHRPNCPNMMKQPAGIVIGFNTAEDAVEAGYNPDPVCHPEAAAVAYAAIEPHAAKATTVSSSATVSTVNTTGAPEVITLSDQVSTLELPSGWKRTGYVVPGLAAGEAEHLDILQPVHGPGRLVIRTYRSPGGLVGERSQPLDRTFGAVGEFGHGVPGISVQNVSRYGKVDEYGAAGAEPGAASVWTGIMLTPNTVGPFDGGWRFIILMSRGFRRGGKAFVVASDTASPLVADVVRSFRFR